jgi:hypothetical protein
MAFWRFLVKRDGILSGTPLSSYGYISAITILVDDDLDTDFDFFAWFRSLPIDMDFAAVDCERVL